MKVIKTNLPGVLIIEPKVFGGERGFFQETWHQEKYEDIGIKEPFVQDNLSFSTRGVLRGLLRGLHYQQPNTQGKLVSVVQGEVFDVAVDIRAWPLTDILLSDKDQVYTRLKDVAAGRLPVMEEK